MFPEKEEISRRSPRGNCPISVETQPPRKNAAYSPSLPPLLPSYLWTALPRSTSFRDNAVQINCHSGTRIECRQSCDELHMAQGIGSLPSCATYPIILVLLSDTLGKTGWDILILPDGTPKKSPHFYFCPSLWFQGLIISEIRLTFQCWFEMS